MVYAFIILINIKNGTITGFGTFLGDINGYSVDEGTEEEVAFHIMKYCTYVKCKLQPLISIDQLDGIAKKLASM